MDYIDYKFIHLVSSKLELFKDLGNDTYNFRCPFCGDSRLYKNKARGYLFSFENVVIYKCHNCGKSASFFNFLREIDHNLFTQYKFEKFGKPSTHKEDSTLDLSSLKFKEFASKSKDALKNCYKLSSIPEDLEPVLEYARTRRIPKVFFDKIYAARSLNEISKYIDRYQDKKFPDFHVLVLPFFRRDGSYSYIQCRSIDSSASGNFRFVTFELDDGAPKLWGEFRTNWLKPIYVLEGPIDAMFVVNGVALAGASHASTLSYIKKRQAEERKTLCLKDICICYDNDYRSNRDIMKQLISRIEEGFSVVIYDKQFKYKDINDAVKDGWSIHDINSYIRGRTFNGLAAKLEVSRLRRG